MKKSLLFTSIILLVFQSFAQKRPLSIEDYDIWNRIRSEQISSNGNLVSYQLVPGKGNETLKLVDDSGSDLLTYTRGENAAISWDEAFTAFLIKPDYDSVRAMKRVGTKEDQMPQDSLGIYTVSSGSTVKIAPVVDMKMPEEWSGYMAYRLDEIRNSEVDTTNEEKSKKSKKVGKKNGYHLVLRNLESGEQDTFKYVTNYYFAKQNPSLLLESKGADSLYTAGIYHYDIPSGSLKQLVDGEYEYKELTISDEAEYVSFLADRDTTKALIRNYELFLWEKGEKTARPILDKSGLKNDWIVSQHGNVRFSDDATKLYFGTSPEPVVEDTTLLDDEKIQVEVWSYTDKRLMTQQENQRKQDKEENFLMVYHIKEQKFVQVADEETPSALSANRYKENLNRMLVYDQLKYYRNVSWEGYPPRGDYYWKDLKTGQKTKVKEGVRAYADLSPAGKYVYWYDVEDTAWYSYDINKKMSVSISKMIPTSVADELDDHPDYPGPYGVAGWTKDDKYMLIYDRYDIWKVDPTLKAKPVNLTNGRDNKTIFRVITLDPENPEVDLKSALLSVFNEEDKSSGYATLMDEKKPDILLKGDFEYTTRPRKAEREGKVLFTKESHTVFPDLLLSSLDFKKVTKLSDANPQQKDRVWSTVEMMEWTSLNGDKLEGLLYKPEGFDPNKKYPMIVYFYERNSNNLHQYHGAFPHRSIINRAYYASRGYLIFIPDIVYRDGYPGQSCYDAVMPGVTQLIDMGFVDEERVGMQGHSWGGYQTAYLATKTDLFACAESGAPVVNMFSAYGGIRWGSGLSRMFQYEHTQSRIGGTIWEYPIRYMENSPLFFMDRVTTPMLIMHNDEDSAVPWYQGIEMFVALRRLGKPAWMLNYNKEPHWPTKRENIVDFQTRMQHFFDHYLMGEPMPEWMSEGIPAIEKGINKGYEPVTDREN